MRKTISTLFILSLLFLGLWAFSAWFFGSTTKETLKNILEDSLLDSYPLDKPKNEIALLDALSYEILESSYTIFGAKLKLSIKADDKNIINTFLQSLDNELLINIDIVNGPLLFEKTGVSLGRSIWRISMDEDFYNSKFTSHNLIQKLPKATIKVGFDNILDYSLPIQTQLNQLNISGTFNPSTSIGQEIIDGNDLIYTTENQGIEIKRFEVKQLQISYNHREMPFKKTHIEWSTVIPELLFKHKTITKPLAFGLTGESTASMQLDRLNSLNSFYFKQKTDSKYPVESGDISFSVTDVSLKHLQKVMTNFNTITELHNQTKWVLEDQSEVPEGQDQIWQLQENIDQLVTELPKLTNELLVNNKQNAVSFAIRTQYQNTRSSMSGSVLPLSHQSLNDSDLSSNDSLLSLFKLVSKVNLDDSLLTYISSKLPINKSKFDLIYKQNKLLMQ